MFMFICERKGALCIYGETSTLAPSTDHLFFGCSHACTVLRHNQAQLLDELVALQMQDAAQRVSGTSAEKGGKGVEEDSTTKQVSEKLRRKLQEKLGKTREKEEKVIKEELQRMTSVASAKRDQLFAKEDCPIAA